MTPAQAQATSRPEGAATRYLAVRDLGLVPYLAAWDLQRRTAQGVTPHRGDTLLLLEHPHTYTCGRSGGRQHLLVNECELEQLEADVVDVDRGGDITYHGPGQLVVYPIIHLFSTPIGRDYRGFVRALEDVLIGLLADFGINAYRYPGYSGAWVAGDAVDEKVAAIGVKVDGRGVTTHGIALNVDPDLGYFGHIVPCGIREKGVTSMTRVLGAGPQMALVKDAFLRHFCRVFEFHVQVPAQVAPFDSGPCEP